MPVQIPFPYFEIEANADGSPKDPAQITALLSGVKQNAITDLFVASHGWNNDPSEAHALYQELFTNVAAQAKTSAPDRRFGVAGIIWPSKRFDVADDAPNAASLGDGHARVARQIDTLADFLSAGHAGAGDKKELAHAKSLLPKLESSAAARKEFAQIILARLPKSVAEEGDHHIDASAGSQMIANDQLLQKLGTPPVKVATSGGGAASMPSGHAKSTSNFQGAAGLGDFLKGVVAGASNLLNYVTYYQMKDRAGKVGRGVVNTVLRRLQDEAPTVRVHLVGHSFGCRVVTAAVTGTATTPKNFVSSMTLLQGAFSHYSFSPSYDNSNKPGFYRNLVTDARVRGAVLITHTRADKAVGLAYAIASRLAGQMASAIGDSNDPFGGLGSNGAQKTVEARDGTMPKAGGKFDKPLANGTMTNLLADGLIHDHSDVRNPDAAYTVLSAAVAGAD